MHLEPRLDVKALICYVIKRQSRPLNYHCLQVGLCSLITKIKFHFIIFQACCTNLPTFLLFSVTKPIYSLSVSCYTTGLQMTSPLALIMCLFRRKLYLITKQVSASFGHNKQHMANPSSDVYFPLREYLFQINHCATCFSS